MINVFFFYFSPLQYKFAIISMGHVDFISDTEYVNVNLVDFKPSSQQSKYILFSLL